MATARIDGILLASACRAAVADIEALPDVPNDTGQHPSTRPNPKRSTVPSIKKILALAECSATVWGGEGQVTVDHEELDVIAPYFMEVAAKGAPERA